MAARRAGPHPGAMTAQLLEPTARRASAEARWPGYGGAGAARAAGAPALAGVPDGRPAGGAGPAARALTHRGYGDVSDEDEPAASLPSLSTCTSRCGA